MPLSSFGWPTNGKIEALREEWFNAQDHMTQRRIGVEIQTEAFNSAPDHPLGLARLPTAIRPDIADVLDGFSTILERTSSLSVLSDWGCVSVKLFLLLHAAPVGYSLLFAVGASAAA